MLTSLVFYFTLTLKKISRQKSGKKNNKPHYPSHMDSPVANILQLFFFPTPYGSLLHGGPSAPNVAGPPESRDIPLHNLQQRSIWTPGPPVPSLDLIFPSVHGAVEHPLPWYTVALGGKRAWAKPEFVNSPVELGKLRHRAKLGIGRDRSQCGWVLPSTLQVCHSFSKHAMGACYPPGSVLGTWDATTDKTDRPLPTQGS